MAGINVVTGTVAPLDQANIDTDQIIPKQFLTGVTRTGYGVNLFHDWRYLNGQKDQIDADFPLNKPEYAGAKILLTRENFGCGSSREHAPWALADFGFSCIIATSFADIFYGNSINNQLLVVTLPNNQLDQIFAKVAQNSKVVVTVELTSQTVKCEELEFPFEIASNHKTNLLKGLDAIGQTLEFDEQITKFEKQRHVWL
ncbi:MAG: 3-isopropylmalate/(R)-2-methylmalate dehydratase small subunit [Alphaproteobacteria bacterium]|jgi:3-isopropylmalate/(R)-2-methylmalate dehydratase small subunit